MACQRLQKKLRSAEKKSTRRDQIWIGARFSRLVGVLFAGDRGEGREVAGVRRRRRGRRRHRARSPAARAARGDAGGRSCRGSGAGDEAGRSGRRWPLSMPARDAAAGAVACGVGSGRREDEGRRRPDGLGGPGAGLPGPTAGGRRRRQVAHAEWWRRCIRRSMDVSGHAERSGLGFRVGKTRKFRGRPSFIGRRS